MMGMQQTYTHKARHSLMWRLHLDAPLILGLLFLLGYGLLVLYSAGSESISLVEKHFGETDFTASKTTRKTFDPSEA